VELRFETVFAEHAPYILRVLPRLGVSEADVDDVAQEIFLAVHRGLAEFEGRSRVRTWIYGISLRVAGNYRRRAHRRREVRGLEIEGSEEPTQGDNLERTRSRQLLTDALDGLSERKREVFVLYEIEELSMAEVAQAVDCPLFTAYARLYAARREMKQAIERVSSRKPHEAGRS
jgi:RNA polymerase sigma-70 factor (ECF subfamily)